MSSTNNLPTYLELFGELDFKEGEEARSVYSPGAYLSDLLQMMDDYFSPVSGAAEDEILDGRREDLKKIFLSAENSFDAIPYLDIVNELLKNRIEAQSSSSDIWSLMKAAKYPLNLPTDFDQIRINKFLDFLSVHRYDLYRIFAQQMDVELIARNYLGLSTEEYTFFITSPETDEASILPYYNNPGSLNDLSSIPEFLLTTGLNGPELRELLYQNLSNTARDSQDNPEIQEAYNFYANAFADGFVKLDDAEEILIWNSSNTLDESIAAIPAEWFSRASKFIRLAQRIKLSFSELGLILRTCCENTINEASLQILSVILQIKKQQELSVEEICSLLNLVNNTGITDEEEPQDLFNRIYNGKYADLEKVYIPFSSYLPEAYFHDPILVEVNGELEAQKEAFDMLTCSGDILEAQNKKFRKRISRALHISEKELLFIIEHYRKHVEEIDAYEISLKDSVSEEGLSLLYKIVKLTEILDVSAKELFGIFDLLEKDPFIRIFNSFEVLIPLEISTRDCYQILDLKSGDRKDLYWLVQTVIAVSNWMKDHSLSAEDLLFIQTGNPGSEKKKLAADKKLVELLNKLYQRFSSTAFGEKQFASEDMSERSSRVVYEFIKKQKDGLCLEEERRIIQYKEELSKRQAFSSLGQLSYIFKNDFKGIGISEAYQNKIFENLIIRNYIHPNGRIIIEKLEEGLEKFTISEDFSSFRTAIFTLINNLFNDQLEFLYRSGEYNVGDDNSEVEISVFLSDLMGLDLGLEEAGYKELFNNLLFNAYIDASGKVINVDFFADPQNESEFVVNAPLGDQKDEIYYLLKKQVQAFSETTLKLNPDIFEELAYTEEQLHDLIENLKFNDYIDEKLNFLDKENFLNISFRDFSIRKTFFIDSKQILSAIQGQLKKDQAQYFTLKKGGLLDVSDELMAQFCYARVVDLFMDGKMIASELRPIFLSTDNLDQFDLGSGFSAVQTKIIYDRIRQTLLDAEKFTLADSTLAKMGFDEFEIEGLKSSLVKAYYLDEWGRLSEKGLAYFSLVDNEITFSLESFEDFSREIFLEIHTLARSYTGAIDHIDDSLKALTKEQERGMYEVLAEGFESSPDVLQKLSKYIYRNPENIVGKLILPIISVLDEDEQITQTPKDNSFLISLRRIEQYLKLADVLKLGPGETEVVFADQDLVEKFPESIILPEGMEQFDALLEGLDKKIYVFKGDKYWAYDDCTYELLEEEIALSELSNLFSGLSPVDAAFIDNEKNAWLTFGDQYFMRGNDAELWKPVSKDWGKIRHNFTNPERIDASFTDHNGKSYLFSDDEYIRSSDAFQSLDESYPKKIEGNWEFELEGITLPEPYYDTIDASFQSPHGKTYFFNGNQFVCSDNYLEEIDNYDFWGKVKNNFEGIDSLDASFYLDQHLYMFSGDQVLRYTDGIENEKVYVDEGFPIKLKSLIPNIPHEFRHGIDSGFKGHDGCVHMFKDDLYIKVSPDFKVVNAPISIADNWGKVRNRFLDLKQVDASFVGLDGKLYLFCDTQYIRYSGINYSKVDEGYPKTISEMWEGMEKVTASFILGEKTYLFGTDGAGDAVYVEYENNEYDLIDEEFPKEFGEGNFWNLPIDFAEAGFNNPDATFKGNDGNTYFFKGENFVYFDSLGRWCSKAQETKEVWDSIPFTSLDAGFTGKDEVSYLFSGDEFVRYSEKDYSKIDSGYPLKIEETWAYVYNTIERTGVIDAAVVLVSEIAEENEDGVEEITTHLHTYLFSGKQYFRYEGGGYNFVEEGYPRSISYLHEEPRFKALKKAWKGSVDAAFADMRNVYLAKEDKLYVLSSEKNHLYSNFLIATPKSAFLDEGKVYIGSDLDWAAQNNLEAYTFHQTSNQEPVALRKVDNSFKTGLDAVLKARDRNTYLFKGSECYNTSLDKCYPIREEWGKVKNHIFEESKIDAAFMGRDGKVYLFYKDQYVSYTPEDTPDSPIPEFVDGLPKSIEKNWGGLKNVHLAFIKNEKTYLIEKGDEKGNFSLLCYSGEDYSKPDRGYPKQVNFSWYGIPETYVEEGFDRIDAVFEDGDNTCYVKGKQFVQYNKEEKLWFPPKDLELIWTGLDFEDDNFKRIHTAFTGVDETIYFFSKEHFVGHRFLSHGVANTIEIFPINERWAKVDNNFEVHSRIDACFVWEEATFLFSGDQYVRYSTDDYRYVDQGYPKTIVEHLRKEPEFTALSDEFELAMVTRAELPDQVDKGVSAAIVSEGTIYLFVGQNMYAYSPMWYRSFGLGNIGRIKNRIQQTKEIDAAYVNKQEQLVLFSGDQYFVYSEDNYEYVDEGYPQKIGPEFATFAGFDLTHLFLYDIDAALRLKDGSIYLFKDEFYLDSNDSSLKKSINDFWGSVSSNFFLENADEQITIDAAFVSPNGMTYVFKGNEYVRYENFSDEYVEEGFPRQIKDNWGDLPPVFETGIDAAFIFEGKTYLFKDQMLGEENEGANTHSQYVRYSNNKYKKIDSIYPQWVKDRWQDSGDFLLSDLRLISLYKHLQDSYSGVDMSLTEFLNPTTLKLETYKNLEEIFGWKIEESKWIKARHSFLDLQNPYEVRFDIESIVRMHEIFRICDKMGNDPSDIYAEIWTNLYSDTQAMDLASAAEHLYRYLSEVNSNQDWAILSEQIQDELNEVKRDLWVPLLISLEDSLSRPRDLFELLLIDVEMGSCAKTSKIKEAISALQLYFHRYFVNLEQADLLGTEDEITRATLKDRWKWMKNYRLWEANRKVFLYPENYIRPELRDTKTPAFQTLEEDLLQGEIDDPAAAKAYKKYLDEYTEVSRLTISGGYVYDDPDTVGNKKLILFGQTKTDPRVYYYRTATFVGGEAESAVWDPWKKVGIQINADRVFPVFAFGRIFVFWASIEEETKASEDSTVTSVDNEDDTTTVSSDAETTYTLKVSFSFYNLNEEWVSEQLLEANISSSNPISNPKLFVENSEKIDGNPHENILVSVSASGINIPHAFILTPELYTRTAAKPQFDDLGREVFKSVFHPDEIGTGEDDIRDEDIVYLNTIEESSDGPWYSFDHKGGSFLLLPAVPSLGPDNQPKDLIGNSDSLPEFPITAAFQALDGKGHYFGTDFFASSDDLTLTGQSPTKDTWGKMFNKLVETGLVSAAYQEGANTFLFSGDEVLRYSGGLALADNMPSRKIVDNFTGKLRTWKKVHASFFMNHRYFFNNDNQKYVRSDSMGTERNTADDWGHTYNVYSPGTVAATAAFSLGDETFLIGSNMILKYSRQPGTFPFTYDHADNGYPREKATVQSLVDDMALTVETGISDLNAAIISSAYAEGTKVNVASQNNRTFEISRGILTETTNPGTSTGIFSAFHVAGTTYNFKFKKLKIGDSGPEFDIEKNIQAAFIGLDDNVYLFSVGEYIFIPKSEISIDRILNEIRLWENGTNPSREIIVNSAFGRVLSRIGQTGIVDAAFTEGLDVVLFSGNEVSRFTRTGGIFTEFTKPTTAPQTLADFNSGLSSWSQVDAAFKDDAENEIYLFNGQEYFILEAGVLSTANQNQDDWGKIKNKITETGVVDAAYIVDAHNGDSAKLFLLSGTEFFKYTLAADGSRESFVDHPDAGKNTYPKTIKANGNPQKIDAAYFHHYVENIYLFFEDTYFKLEPDQEPDSMAAATAIKGTWGNIHSTMRDGFDAAVEIIHADPANPVLYFFKDGKYIKYQLPTGDSKDEASQDLPAYPYEIKEAKFDIIRLTSGTSYKLNEPLFSGGVDALLDLETQQIDEIPAFNKFGTSDTVSEKSDIILVKSHMVNVLPISSHLDFSSANGIYYWEVFFHAPYLIAQSFFANQRFEDAKRWYEFIFDPTERTEYWKFLPFLAVDTEAIAKSMEEILAKLSGLGMDMGVIESGGVNAEGESVKGTTEIISKLKDLEELFQGLRLKTNADTLNLDFLSDLGSTLDEVKNDGNLNPVDGEDMDEAESEKHQLLELLEITENLSDTYTNIVAKTDDQLKMYLDDPFDPHAIAGMRKLAYRKAVVMAYVDNLIEWGDMLFRKYTVESINEARMLYILAYDLLGQKPESMGKRILSDDQPHQEIFDASDDYELLLFLEDELEDAKPDDSLATIAPELLFSGTVHDSILTQPYFFIPENEIFLSYWDTVEDRLFKIRHCLNILGIKQPLPLFQPPIDPMAVVQSVAGGGGLGQFGGGSQVAVPHYKFDFLMMKVESLISKLNQFGSELLATLEKKDAEALSLMQSEHEGNILNMMIKVREAQIEESQQNIRYLEESKANAKARAQHYDALIDKGMLPEETAQLVLMSLAAASHYVSAGLKIGAMVASAVPDSMIGPFIMGVKVGGSNFGPMLSEAAGIAEGLAEGFSVTGEALAVTAQHVRMVEDWDFQRLVAVSEEKQLEFQIAGAKAQEKGAIQELASLKKEISQNESIQEFYKEKFTNVQLYQWMIGKMSGLYYQTYKLAFDMAKSAEKSLQFERALKESDANFINGMYWNSQRKGLLAGESLGLDVDRMQQHYIEINDRLLEITKEISLLELDPLAFLELKTKGSCEFYLSEALFDYDFPSHYCRQIATLSVSFDVGDGVFVHATLTQLNHTTLLEADPKAVKFLLEPKGLPPASIRNNWRNNQQIVLSHFDEYEKNNGLFELRYDSDRYLPFEGTGAISRWKLELNGKQGSLNLNELLSVSINLKYTAVQGGPAYGEAVKGMLKPFEAPKFFDMNFDFAREWNGFLDGEENELVLPFTRKHFPNMSGGKIIGIFTRFELAEEASASMTLSGDDEWVLKDGKYLETAGLSISSKGSDLRFSFKGNKAKLRNLQFVFLYKASVS